MQQHNASLRGGSEKTAYYASLGEERPQFAFMTEREEVYADTATAEEAEAGTHKFVTLGDLGQDIE